MSVLPPSRVFRIQVEALEMGLVSTEFVQQQVASLQDCTAWQQQYSALSSPDMKYPGGYPLGQQGQQQQQQQLQQQQLGQQQLQRVRRQWAAAPGGQAGQSVGESQRTY